MTRKTLGGLVNDVGFRLLRTTASGPGNTLLSPASIFMALAAIGTATRGLTQHEVAQVIGVHLDDIEATASALRTICSADPSLLPAETMDGAWVLHPTVELAMTLWLRNGVSLTPSFTAANTASYHAEIATVDFADPTLPRVVNDWVRQHTHGRITHVVESFDPLSVLCLLTTLYAHGTWSTPFDHGNTQEDHFYMRPGQSVVLPMMQQVGQFAYVDCDDVQALRLPVTGGDMELCLVLPHETACMSALLERLTSTTWDGWIARQVIRRGTLMLPRFGVDYSAEPSLIPYLSALGLRRPFDPQQADFAGLCTAHLPDDAPIFINRIIHNTHFAVDEDGVVAAAATAVEVREIGRRYAPSQKEFTMIVNRPFLCALRQASSGVLLFLGIIDHPA